MSARDIWLVGTGPMAVEYHKVLSGMGLPETVIGRGQVSASVFKERTGVAPWSGGLEAFLATGPGVPDAAIVAVGVDGLCAAADLLVDYGVKTLLVEKPGALELGDLEALARKARSKGSRIAIGYNRRYYSSVRTAEELIAAEGGLRSMTFEFTEWSHQIEKLPTNERIKNHWLLANSTHVIDLAFHLAGQPAEWSYFHQGNLDWHPAAAAFAGAGRTDRDVLFSYCANWSGPGRWGLEVVTDLSRYIFRPLEKLQVMRKGSVAIEPLNIEDSMDTAYKAGLYKQVEDFLAGKPGRLCLIDEQLRNWVVYRSIAGY